MTTATQAPLLDPEFLHKLEQLELLSRKIFVGRMKGERKSKRRGSSVEFADPSTNQAIRRGWLFYQGQIFGDGSDDGSGWIFRIYHPPDGDASAPLTALSVPMSLDTNKWYHIVGTYKSSPNNQSRVCFPSP